jgi:hypothetical protein
MPTWSASYLTTCATLIVISVGWLDDDFFRLSTRIVERVGPMLTLKVLRAPHHT